MKIALFFGSFNPIHIGHLIIATHILNHTPCNKVWFVVSPHNPFKQQSNLLNEYDRLHLVQLCIEKNDDMDACSIEFSLPKPSYTIDTLVYLKEKYPTYEFSLIMGTDNILNIHKWKNYNQIITNYDIWVYQRHSDDNTNIETYSRVKYINGPLLDISSTYIRNSIKIGNSIRYLVHDKVYDYIIENNLYR